MRDHLAALRRSLRQARTWLEYRSAGGSIYIAVDCSEIFAYACQQAPTIHELPRGPLPWAWMPHAQHLDQAVSGYRLSLHHLFSPKSPPLVLPPHLGEMMGFVDRRHDAFYLRDNQLRHDATQAYDALPERARNVLVKLKEGHDLTNEERVEVQAAVAGGFEQICRDVADAIKRQRRGVRFVEGLKQLVRDGCLLLSPEDVLGRLGVEPGDVTYCADDLPAYWQSAEPWGRGHHKHSVRTDVVALAIVESVNGRLMGKGARLFLLSRGYMPDLAAALSPNLRDLVVDLETFYFFSRAILEGDSGRWWLDALQHRIASIEDAMGAALHESLRGATDEEYRARLRDLLEMTTKEWFLLLNRTAAASADNYEWLAGAKAVHRSEPDEPPWDEDEKLRMLADFVWFVRSDSETREELRRRIESNWRYLKAATDRFREIGVYTSPFHSCFISHSSDDLELASRLHRDLRDRGIQASLAADAMRTGEKFRQAIHDRIDKCDRVIVLLSQPALDSPWVENEVEVALRKAKGVMPLLIQRELDLSAPAWTETLVATRHVADFTQCTEEEAYGRALAQLVRDLSMEPSVAP